MASLPPFADSTQYLQVSTLHRRQGLDYDNLRDTFVPLESITFTNKFTNPITKKAVNGTWYYDKGMPPIDVVAREERQYCNQGLATYSFSGSCLIVRLLLDSGQGSASILIDGVKPSTIATLSTKLDTLSCNLEDYSMTVPQYYDVVVADGLSSGSHTLQIVAMNSVSQYFIMSGIKIRNWSLADIIRTCYYEGASSGLNNIDLQFRNESRKAIRNLKIYLPVQLIDRLGNPFPNPIIIDSLPGGGNYTINGAIDGTTVENSLDTTIPFYAEYEDFTGDIPGPGTTNYALTPKSQLINFGSGWVLDQDTWDGRWRAFNERANKSFTFNCSGTSFNITYVRDWGWGAAKVYVNGNCVATLSCNATDQIPSGKAVETIGNLPVGENLITITATGNGDHPFVFTNIDFVASLHYTAVTETIKAHLDFEYLKPMGVKGLRYMDDGALSWNRINLYKRDYSIPRTNRNVKEVHIMRRFPNYCVNYSDKKHENMKYYDLLIVDPGTSSRAEVAAWQAMGIKVFGYISFGEEDGELIDPWNEKSRKRPAYGDRQGPGGYASYYNKGGNGYGETSQCIHDNRIKLGTTTCELARSEYFAGTGSCTKVCQNDWRDGFYSHQNGDPCKGGYTSANQWKRSAAVACMNEACPKYAPYNNKCPMWANGGGWGTDLTLAETDYPDQNGIWGSSYINPISPAWKERIKNQYFPRVFGLPQQVQEEPVVAKKYVDAGGVTSYVFRVHAKVLDRDLPTKIVTADRKYSFSEAEYSFDNTSGAFQIANNSGADAGLTLVDGMNLLCSYYTAGIGADGVFMDTLDTVDVYPSPTFQQAMADMINSLKQEYPDKSFCANRGFTITEKTVASTDYIMFESFLTDYDWDTKTYHKVTDPDSIKFNNDVKAMLSRLRKTNVFDVLALNYCNNDSSGDDLREYIMQECYKEGYFSWSSVIDLDDPIPPVLIKDQTWKTKVDPDNPYLKLPWAVDEALAVRIQNEVKIWGVDFESSRLWTRQLEVERDGWHDIQWFEVNDLFVADVTTLAWCWKLSRKDGKVMGFTSHDKDLYVEGLKYTASTGFTPTAVASSGNLSTDNLTASGLITSDDITEYDLLNGVYDGATVEVFVVDWVNSSNGVFTLRKGTLGEVSPSKTAFEAEIRGLMEPLQATSTDVYSKTCRATLGDAKCKYNVAETAVAGTVSSVNQDGSFTTTLSNADSYFDYGVLKWTSGKNKDQSYEVEVYQKANGYIRLLAPPIQLVNVNDTFTVTAGCNGLLSTCKNKFGNISNFRGEPYTPGTSFSVSYPLKTSSNIVPEGADVRRGDYTW